MNRVARMLSGISRKTSASYVICLGLFFACGTALPAEPAPHVAHKFDIEVNAPVRAMAFDAKNAHLYVAAGRELHDYDVATGASVGTLTLPGPVIDIVTNASESTGYAVVGSPAKLITFGLHPLKVERSTVLADGAPSALLYDPVVHAVFVESTAASTLSKFDAGTGRRVGSLSLPGKLRQMVINDRGTLYVDDQAHDAIDVVDEAHTTLMGAIPVTGCNGPTGLAMDPVGRRLFVGCEDGMRLIVDADLGFTFERLPSSVSGPSRMLFTFRPGGFEGWKGATVSVGTNNRVAIIQMKAFVKYSTAGDVSLPGAYEAMALDKNTHQIWLALRGPMSNPHAIETSIGLWTLDSSQGAPQ